MSPRMQVALFKVVAVTEAFSWLGLLVGMYFKYFTNTGDLGVRIFGPIHGGIFILYVLMALVVARTLRWGRWTAGTALLSSVPPFATLAFELWAARTARLAPLPRQVPDAPQPRAA